jgi:hypothetical protein
MRIFLVAVALVLFAGCTRSSAAVREDAQPGTEFDPVYTYGKPLAEGEQDGLHWFQYRVANAGDLETDESELTAVIWMTGQRVKALSFVTRDGRTLNPHQAPTLERGTSSSSALARAYSYETERITDAQLSAAMQRLEAEVAAAKTAQSAETVAGPDAYCCKVCVYGQPCGNTCIRYDAVCKVGSGCAC